MSYVPFLLYVFAFPYEVIEKYPFTLGIILLIAREKF